MQLQGFKSVNLSRTKSKKSNNISGGISVFVRTSLKSGVRFLDHRTSDYIWLKLCKTFFGISDDIYLCFIYNPPSNLSYSKSLDDDIFDLLEKDIEKYWEKGRIILAGDMNSRTGNEQADFIQEDCGNDFSQIFDNYNPDLDIDQQGENFDF